jgi:hypothetical protein
MSRSITRAAFARQKNVDPSRVTRWIQAGMPLAKDGGINTAVADEWLAKNVDPSKRIYCAAAKASAARAATHVKAGTSRRSQQEPLSPPGVGHLDDPVNVTLACALPMLATRLPRAAAAVAAERGMPPEMVDLLFRCVAVAGMAEVTGLLDSLGVPPPPKLNGWEKADMWDLDDFGPAPLEAVR